MGKGAGGTVRRKAKRCFFLVGPRIDKPPFHPDCWLLLPTYIHITYIIERCELTAFYTQPKWVHKRIVRMSSNSNLSQSAIRQMTPQIQSGVRNLRRNDSVPKQLAQFHVRFLHSQKLEKKNLMG